MHASSSPRAMSISLLDVIENTDKKYDHQKLQLFETSTLFQLCSLAILVTTVGLSILGLVFCASESSKKVTAGVLINLVALPISYLAYNFYRSLENLKRISEHPGDCKTFLSTHIDRNLFRKKLLENTFFFEWLIDIALENLYKRK